LGSVVAASAAAALALALLTTSCGEGEDAGEPAAPETSIVVTLWPKGRDGGSEHTALLECNPPGGTHDRIEEACAALEREGAALAPVAGDAICTQIYGGDQEARVFGTVRGQEVDVLFNRTNGCEIDRWDKLAPLLEIATS
jgi:hypothetical protein